MDLAAVVAMVTMLLAFWAVILWARLRLCYIHAVGVILTLNMVGVFLVGEGAGGAFVTPYLQRDAHYEFSADYPWIVFGIGMLAFALGVAYMRSRSGEFESLAPPGGWQGVGEQYNTLLAIVPLAVIVLAAAYMLFAIGGIPLLSRQAGEARFTITEKTGPFWRMQEIGLPTMMVLTGVHAYWVRNSRGIWKGIFWGLLLSSAVANVLRGNKGGLLWIVMYVGMLGLVVIPVGRRRTKFIRVMALAMVGALGAVYVVGRMILPLSNAKVLRLLAARVTSAAGVGFYEIVAMLTPRNGLQFGAGQLHGLYAFLSVLRIYPPGFLDLGGELPRILFGNHRFEYPITITALGDFYYDFGLAGIIAGSALLGGFCYWIYSRTLLANNPTLKALLIVAQVQICMYANRGAIIGMLGSVGIGLLMVFVPFFAIRWGLKQTGPQASATSQSAFRDEGFG